MKNIKYAILICIFISLFTLLIFVPKTDSTIIWINLDGQSNLDDDLKYNKDIAEFITKNKNISNKFDTQEDRNFFNVSLSYINEVYSQNPNVKEYKPTLLLSNFNNPIIIDIFYYVNIKNNSYIVNLSAVFTNCKTVDNYEGFGNEEVYNFVEYFIENITDCFIKELTARKNTDFVFVGTDHGLSLLTIKLAKKMNPKSKIGLFVLDEHIDIYGIKDHANLVNKANVFGKLILEEYVDYIVFFGASDAAKSIVQTSVDKNFTRNDIFNKMSVYSDEDTRSNKWKHIISKEIYKMKKRGITNVLISVDVDVLPSQYTGFEYSILAPAIGIIRYGTNRTDITLAEFPEGFSKGLEPEELRDYIRFIKYYSLRNGMHFGVTKNTIKILGDVQELLPSQDLSFDTTKAAKIIIDSYYQG